MDRSSAATADSSAFACRLCGHCCEGRGGIVVSERDLRRLLKHMGLTHDEFERRYGERRGGKLHIRNEDSGACVFFQRGQGCLVHPAKPDICRAWPYFRGNLVDRESLELAKDFCPGIPLALSHEEFVRQGLASLQEAKLVGAGAPDEAGALQVADLLEKLAKNGGKG